MARCALVPLCASLCALVLGGLLSGAAPEQLVIASIATESVCCNGNISCGRCCVPDQRPASSPTRFHPRGLAELIRVNWTPEEDRLLAQMASVPSSSTIETHWPRRTVSAVQRHWYLVRARCVMPCTPHPTLQHSKQEGSIDVTIWGEPRWGPLIDWTRDDCGHTNKLGPYTWTPDSGPGKKGAWVRTKVESAYRIRPGAVGCCRVFP